MLLSTEQRVPVNKCYSLVYPQNRYGEKAGEFLITSLVAEGLAKPAVGNQGFLALVRAFFLFLSLNFLTVLAHMPPLAGIRFLPRLLLYPINKGLNSWMWLCCGRLFFCVTHCQLPGVL